MERSCGLRRRVDADAELMSAQLSHGQLLTVKSREWRYIRKWTCQGFRNRGTSPVDIDNDAAQRVHFASPPGNTYGDR